MKIIIKYKQLFLFKLFLSLLPYFFISILIMNALGYSYSEIMSISAMTQIVAVIFNFPLGIYAEQRNRKKVLLLNNILSISAFILFLFENFYLAILDAVILGVSEALSSGVMQTFSYEQFLDDKTYREYLEKSNFIQYLAVAVMTIITPAILQFNRFLPIILSIVFIILSTIFLCFIKSGKREEKKQEKVNLSLRILQKELKTSKSLSLFVILGITITTLIMSANSWSSILLKYHHFSLKYLGLILFIFNLCMAIGSRIKWGKISLVLFLPLLSILLFFTKSLFMTIILFSAFRLINGSYNNFFIGEFNKRIKNNRVIFWSIYDTFLSFWFILADLSSGFISQNLTVEFIYLIFGSISLFIFLIYILLSSSLQAKSKVI
ncbi:MFS transporter [Lactococcus cremoris]|uniref:MFS transporter n=1 Tax=Lactococcus lactis subsp. cremoris TaxID=1359 RepID=UPI00218245BA|nr:MFS transporter [Lactococcus cremoris]MCT0477709.1 MFS transporter [Lactococcus cremoris]